MILFDSKMKHHNRGIEWLRYVKNNLRTENDTVTVNCPPFFGLDE